MFAIRRAQWQSTTSNGPVPYRSQIGSENQTRKKKVRNALRRRTEITQL